jgi:acetylglutamate synthase
MQISKSTNPGLFLINFLVTLIQDSISRGLDWKVFLRREGKRMIRRFRIADFVPKVLTDEGASVTKVLTDEGASVT